MAPIKYSQIAETKSFYGLSLGLAMLAGLGLYAAYEIEQAGHYITGMNNQIVWGLPHIFAITLILSASGVLNVTSLSSVFGKSHYQPLARLSGLLGITLLTSGLAVLVLDLGRPDRLLIAMTHYNFKSIFTWNIFLYTGLILLVAGYLWVMMDRRLHFYYQQLGLWVFIGRLVLTTGTGSIFGFLVAREAYSTAILAPLFIALSLALGMAVFLLVLLAIFKWGRRDLGIAFLQNPKRLLGIFIAAVFYLLLVYQLTHLYITGRQEVAYFFLLEGGLYTLLFWLGYLILGTLVPLLLIYLPQFAHSITATASAAGLVVIGSFALLYVLIIGGQAYPLEMFPNHRVLESSFFDAGVNRYTPSIWEWLLGIGSFSFAGVLTLIGLRVLPFLFEPTRDV